MQMAWLWWTARTEPYVDRAQIDSQVKVHAGEMEQNIPSSIEKNRKRESNYKGCVIECEILIPYLNSCVKNIVKREMTNDLRNIV